MIFFVFNFGLKGNYFEKKRKLKRSDMLMDFIIIDLGNIYYRLVL